MMTKAKLVKEFKKMVDEHVPQIFINYVRSPAGFNAAHIKELKDYAFAEGYKVDHETPYDNYPQETFSLVH